MKTKFVSVVVAVCVLFCGINAFAQQAYESTEMLNKDLRPSVSIVVTGDKALTKEAVIVHMKKEGLPVKTGKFIKAENTVFSKVSSKYLNVYVTVTTLDKKLSTQKVSVFLSTGDPETASFLSRSTDAEAFSNLKSFMDNNFVAHHAEFMKNHNIDEQVKAIATSNKKLESYEKELARLKTATEKTTSQIEAQRQKILEQQQLLQEMKNAQ